jgi:heavy metal sensor kinase
MTLTTRLSVFFLTALALVLAGFSTGLYLLARSYLYRQADERLAAALETLVAAADVEDGEAEWKPEERVLTLGEGTGPEQVRWQVEDAAGRTLARSPNLGGEALLGAPPVSPPGQAEPFQVTRQGQRWLVLQRRVSAEQAPAGLPGARPAPSRKPRPRNPLLVLTGGLSLAPVEATLRRLGGTLAGLSLGVWLAAALLGRWLCRRALLPVRRMAESAWSMNAASLERRLPVPATGDELAELGGAFNGLLSRLQESFERQRRFTGDASHQLRTPLTALLGQLEVALRRDRPSEEYRRVLELAQGQAAHLRRIVEALLFLARADAEARAPEVETIALSAWVPEHLRGWTAQGRAADLRTDCPADDPCPVRVQPALLGQLLDNLLENACKYSEPGSPVTIRVRREGGTVSLSVEDAGHGIAAEDLPHVFEPFYRSAHARKMGLAGVGLGLAVVQRIAAALGGSIQAENGSQRGACFTLRLDAAPSA